MDGKTSEDVLLDIWPPNGVEWTCVLEVSNKTKGRGDLSMDGDALNGVMSYPYSQTTNRQ